MASWITGMVPSREFLTQIIQSCFGALWSGPSWNSSGRSLRRGFTRSNHPVPGEDGSVSGEEAAGGDNALKDLLAMVTTLFSIRYLVWEFRRLFEIQLAYIMNGWNIISLLSYTLILISTTVEMVLRHSRSTRELASIGTLLVWTKTLYYLRGFRGTGALVRMIIQILRDMRFFVLIMILMSTAFIQVYLILNTKIVQPDEPLELFWVVYNTAWIGNIGQGYDGQFIERVMYIIMTLVMIVVLLNLLIAIMGDTFARVQANANIEFYLNFAELIFELESTMPAADWDSELKFPKYMIYSTAVHHRANEDDEGELSKDGKEIAREIADVAANEALMGRRIIAELRADVRELKACIETSAEVAAGRQESRLRASSRPSSSIDGVPKGFASI
eukprot:gnl/TRDRNA2_/TRDRNA2_177352_c0_seq2.p1 gnl/TRDRNA2_/TRDRNA2_177352_c0~~gnl/TRDRNA2_/TRDRNA2_177352_c0_seq2.p1  ORF type:complete len:389 (-),score=65.86 gnl/TRDRNA2_/TRDRNA2_177352_c0_seq2:50-1216(-)